MKDFLLQRILKLGFPEHIAKKATSASETLIPVNSRIRYPNVFNDLPPLHPKSLFGILTLDKSVGPSPLQHLIRTYDKIKPDVTERLVLNYLRGLGPSRQLYLLSKFYPEILKDKPQLLRLKLLL